MTDNIPVQNIPLADQVFEIILRGILDREYSPGSQLPSENELVEKYKVSRPTIRTAFARLGELGYIVKKRGVGTFVSNSPGLLNPLFLSYNIMDRISSRGFSPGFKQQIARKINADEEIAKKLDISVGSPILNLHKLFTADDKPIIYFENFIPEWVYQGYLTEDEVLAPGRTQPFFKFFAQDCQKEIKFLTSVIHPCLMENCDLPKDFNIYGPTTALLTVEDIGYSNDSLQLFLTKEYLFEEAGYFHVVRQVGNI